MSVRARLVLLALLLAAVGAFVFWLTRGGGQEEGAAPAPLRASGDCRSCHAAAFDEWRASHHAIAYTNPEVRKLSDDFRNKECASCHLPRPISKTGLLQRTLPRLTRPDEGVDCLACHLRRDDRIAGRVGSDRGCSPVADRELLSVALCETCHNQHQTTDQWRESRYAREGVTCVDCHMPVVERTDGRKGRRHVFEGCHDVEMLRRAGTFTVASEGSDVVLALVNDGAGHNFPTEERHRAVDILLRFVDASGKAGPWQRVYRFRQPYRDEPGENTQLPAGEKHVSRVPWPEGAVRAEARLWYRLNPYATDDDPASTLLFERTIER